MVIGRFDSRIKGYDPEPLARSADYDPSLSPYLAIYSATFNDYVRRTLKFESDLPYEMIADVRPWNYANVAQNQYLDVAEDLK